MKLAIALAVVASACSPSGDVCTGITVTKSNVDLEITTAAKYFSRYQLCVKGPRSKACKSFPIHEADAGSYASTVRWNTNFPDQGKGLYRVTWQYYGKTLTFRR